MRSNRLQSNEIKQGEAHHTLIVSGNPTESERASAQTLRVTAAVGRRVMALPLTVSER